MFLGHYCLASKSDQNTVSSQAEISWLGTGRAGFCADEKMLYSAVNEKKKINDLK